MSEGETEAIDLFITIEPWTGPFTIGAPRLGRTSRRSGGMDDAAFSRSRRASPSQYSDLNLVPSAPGSGPLRRCEYIFLV